MDKWRMVTLSDITTIIGDGLHGTPIYDDKGDYFFINGNNLNEGIIEIKNDTKRVGEEEYEKYIKPLSDKTILLSINGTIGNLALYNNEKCMLGKSACFINVNEMCERTYLYFALRSADFQYYIREVATGTTIPNVPLKGLRKYSLHLPPLPEQRAIAGVLSSLDDKIDLLHRQNRTLEAMAETLFRQWFVEEADEGWEEGKLKDIIDVLSGYAFKSSIFIDSGRYRLVTIKAVQDGFLDLNRASYINDLPSKMPGYCKLQDKDILLSLTGNVGRCCLVDTANLLLNQRVAKIHPINEQNRVFAYCFFRNNSTRSLLEEMSKGTAQANLSPIETANIPLFIPPKKNLESFSAISTPLFEKIFLNRKEIQSLSKLRDYLLPKLMSGEVRVAV